MMIKPLILIFSVLALVAGIAYLIAHSVLVALVTVVVVFGLLSLWGRLLMRRRVRQASRRVDELMTELTGKPYTETNGSPM